jgi:hypothetical protein
MFLFAYAADQRGWKDIVAPFKEERDEIAAVASGFSWHASRALERGPIRGISGETSAATAYADAFASRIRSLAAQAYRSRSRSHTAITRLMSSRIGCW